jgi:peptidoglycan LD-endopeptidase CwlK
MLKGKSEKNLLNVHPDLIKLAEGVAKLWDIVVIEGFRSMDRQNELYEQGYSKLKYPKSKHNSLPSRAIDICPYPINWENIKEFKELGEDIKKVAIILDIDVQWGGDWKSFKDYPHWQLSNKE